MTLATIARVNVSEYVYTNSYPLRVGRGRSIFATSGSIFVNKRARDGEGNDDDDVMDGRGDVITPFLDFRGFVTCHSPSSANSCSRQACVTICIQIRPYRVELVIYNVRILYCNVVWHVIAMLMRPFLL